MTYRDILLFSDCNLTYRPKKCHIPVAAINR